MAVAGSAAQAPHRGRLLAGLLALLVVATVAHQPATATAATDTLAPVADAYVNQAAATTRYGTTTTLRVKAAPSELRSYLRFSVPALAGPVTRATLRLSTDWGAGGYSVRPVTNTSWSESTIRWNTAPAIGAVTSSSTTQPDGWTAVDVTSLVTRSGLRSFALTTISSAETIMASRETGSRAPQLVVETSDTTAPVVSLSTPPDGSVTASTTPQISGVAGTRVGDAATVAVNLYAGSTASGTAARSMTTTRGADGTWSVAPSPGLAEGVYTAQAEQSDTSGNVGRSAPRTFTVDTTAPAVTLAAPSDGMSTPEATPLFAGQAGFSAGDDATVTVRLYAGSSAEGPALQSLSATKAADGAWSVRPASLSEGTYTARAEQSDAAGNIGRSASRTFTVDSTAPAVTLTAPAHGSIVGDRPTFSGAAGTDLEDGAQVTVSVYRGSSATGLPVATMSADRVGATWSVRPLLDLAEGPYAVRAEQTDSAGNIGRSSVHTFDVDTTAPAVTLTSPGDASVTANPTPTFAGQAGTAAGDNAQVDVTIYAGATASGTPLRTLTADVAADGAWSAAPATALPDGTYTARAQQLDVAGNVGSSSASSFAVDTSAPGVSLVAPADGSSIAESRPTFSGRAGTASGDSSTVTVTVHAGTDVSGATVQTLTATRDGADWSVRAADALPDGTYTARAEQTGATGASGRSGAPTFTIDTSAPSVSLLTPLMGQELPTGSPTFSGNASDAAGDLPAVTVRIHAGTSLAGTLVQTLAATRGGDGAWSVTPSSSLVNGTYTAQAQQRDDAGNTATSTATTFTVNVSTIPTVTLDQPADGAVLSDETPQVSGTASSSSEVTVRIYAGSGTGGTVEQTLTTTRNGSAWSVTANALSSGTHTVQAEQRSDGGAIGRSAAHAFTVDTVAPAVTLTTPQDGSTSSDTTPALAGSAGDAPGDAATVKVRVFAGVTVTGSVVQTSTTTRSAGSWGTTADALAPGTYTVRAEQTDAAGNVGHSSPSTFLIGQTYREEVLADDPRAYWRYGETSGTVAADLGSANNPATYTNAPALGVPGSLVGDPDKAVRFDGTNDFVASGDPASGALDLGTGDVSIEAWIKTSVNGQQSVLGKQGASGAYWQLLVTNATSYIGKLRASFYDGTTLRQGYSSVRVDDGAWHHVVVTFVRATGMDIYVDGNRATKAGALTTSIDNAAPFQVGKITGYGYYTGDIDEVAIYNHALTPARVSAHLAAAQGPDRTPPAATLTEPAASSVTDDRRPSFAGRAGTGPGDLPAMTVKIYSGSNAAGGPLQTLGSTATTSGSWSATATESLGDGTYTAEVEQADSLGNVGLSAPRTFQVSGGATSASYRQAVLDSGPRGYWRLGETSGSTAADKTTNDNPGSALGDPWLGASGAVVGDPNSAWRFDGVNDQVNVGDPASGTLDLGAGDFTLEAWIKTTASGTRSIMGKQASTGPNWQLLVTDAPGYVGRVRASFYDGKVQRQGYSAIRVDDGAWHHVAVSMTRTTGMDIYVDGDRAIKLGALPGSLDNAASLDIGKITGYPYFNGDIDEVAVYTRALPETEIASHHAQGTRLENTSPAISLTSPTAGATTTDATPRFAGRAGAAAGDLNPVTVKVYEGSAAGGTALRSLQAVVGPERDWTLEDGSTLPAGTYTAQAEQRDTSANVGRSAAVTFTVDPAPPSGADDPVMLAAGDIAGCSTSGDEQTAALLDGLPGTVQTLGDNAYDSGTASEFTNCYGPTWGRHKARTRPAVGDHEYGTPGASGYFNYFGAAAGDPSKGYYSYDLGSWHVVVTNSVCDQVPGGCGPGSPQEQWIRSDLAASSATCEVAILSGPRFSSGTIHGPDGGFQGIWQALYDHGVDVVLSGDDHVYERFAPLTPDGRSDGARGIREFIVGTGGRSHYSFGPAQVGSEVRDSATFGILKLSMHPSAYDWQFVPVAGQSFTDAGSQACH